MTTTSAPAFDPDAADRLVRALGLQLTQEQHQVVFGAPDGPAVVIAGAGSGKTSVMAARIAVLVAAGTVPAEAILGLTFTRKAAAELSERVDSLLRSARRAHLIDPMGGEPEISTYHSFAQRFVREHGIWVGIDPDLRVESDFALLPLAYRVAAGSAALANADHDFTLPTAVSAMRTLDAALAEHVVDPDRLREQEAHRQQGMAAARDNDKIRRLLAASRARAVASNLVDDWRQAKADAGVMDYADMMRLAHRTASGSDEAVQRCRAAYRAVLLDEYQDTSVVQRMLLQRLFGDGHRLLAVGDPKQSIYAFRGAAAASMQAFVHHFPASDGSPARVYALTANFRSGATIVDVANAAAATQRATRAGSPGSQLRVGRTDIQDAVEVHTFRSAADECRFVVAQVAHEMAQGRSPDEVIVLARSNSDVSTYAGALVAAGIPVTSSDQAGLFELPEIADVLATIAVVVDPGANADLMRLLTGPRWAIGLRDLALLGARARQLAGPPWRAEDDAEVAAHLAAATAGSDPVELPSLADALADPGDAGYSAQARQRFAQMHAELDEVARHAGDPVPDLIARILRVTGMDAELLLGDDAVRRLAAVEALLSVAGQFQVGDPAAGASGFLRAVRLAGQADADPGFDPPLAVGCVRVMTVHKAKGLQAEVVLLPGFTEAAFDKVVLKDHWTTTPGGLPDDLRGDLLVPGPLATPMTAPEVEQLRELASREAAAESERLVYVALTRARSRLIVSSHWWQPGRARAKAPSRHLLDLTTMPAVSVGQWYEPAEGASNPLADEEAQEHTFPRWDDHARQRRRATASAVLHARAHPPVVDGAPTSPAEAELIARWDRDIDALRRERLAQAHHEEVISVPDGLTVTALQRLVDDPQAYARGLRRPMPARPSVQARRGTRFHEWVAARWEQRALIDESELAEDRALDVVEDAGLADLMAAFENGAYADRAPAHIEYPFTVVIAGVPVTGRIDAIYGNHQDGWEVVDWKTSGTPEADPLQLAVYRVAWAALAGVDPAQVTAVFYFVPTGLRVEPADLPDESTLGRLLTEAPQGRDQSPGNSPPNQSSIR